MSARRTLKTCKLNRLLHANTHLNKIHIQADNISTFNKKLKNYLNPSLGKNCQLTNYSSETVAISCNSSAWATKLRFLIPELLVFFKSECGLTKLKSIRILVSPTRGMNHFPLPNRTRPVRKLNLSNQSAKFIEDVALSIEDSALRESILRISNHRK